MSDWQLDLSNHQDSCRLCFDKSPGNDRPLSAAESCRLGLFVVPVKSWKTWRSGQMESYENRSKQRTYDCNYDYGYDFVHACGYDCHYDYAYAYGYDCDSDYVCLWLWLGLCLYTIFNLSSSLLCTEQPGWIQGGKNLAIMIQLEHLIQHSTWAILPSPKNQCGKGGSRRQVLNTSCAKMASNKNGWSTESTNQLREVERERGELKLNSLLEI